MLRLLHGTSRYEHESPQVPLFSALINFRMFTFLVVLVLIYICVSCDMAELNDHDSPQYPFIFVSMPLFTRLGWRTILFSKSLCLLQYLATFYNFLQLIMPVSLSAIQTVLRELCIQHVFEDVSPRLLLFFYFLSGFMPYMCFYISWSLINLSKTMSCLSFLCFWSLELPSLSIL